MITDEKLFGCPYCGFRIDPGEEVCSRCGNKFESGTRFECPFCGDLVGPEMEECPGCHINFSEFKARVKKTAKADSIDTLLMDIIRLEASEVKNEAKRFSCPSCDLLLEGTEQVCPRCKTDLSEQSAFQCPVCGEFVDSEALKCSECGASFEDDEEEEMAIADHEALSSALDDILTSAGHTDPLPEPVNESVVPEPVPELPIPEPREVAAPEPEPTNDVLTTSAPEPVPLQTIEESPPPPETPKKPRQRKLKARPTGNSGRDA